jgi:hypothetical protein
LPICQTMWRRCSGWSARSHLSAPASAKRRPRSNGSLIIKKLQRSQFGRRAEQLDDGQLQLGFEDLNADVARTEARLPPTKAGIPTAQNERLSLPMHLPREEMRLETNRSLSGLARRSTLICYLSTKISASIATRDRNRSQAIPKISRHKSGIGCQHRPILSQLPARLNLRQGQAVIWNC